MSIPLWSQDLVELIRGIGVDNFDLYDAVIIGEGGVRWTDYHAVNVLGLVAAADLSRSRFTKIMSSPDGTPLAGFRDLVVDPARVAPYDLVRLAESPSTLIVSDRVLDALGRHPRPGGWGITAFPIDEAGAPT